MRLGGVSLFSLGLWWCRYLVHESEDHFRVVFKPSRKLAPELPELSRCRSVRVTGVSDYTSGAWLLGWVVVSHVVVWVENGVCSLGYGNVVDGVGVVAKMLKAWKIIILQWYKELESYRLVEFGSQSVGEGTHSLQEESYPEEIGLHLKYVVS